MTSPSAPAKSQPLHNFTLPLLKWNKDGKSSGQHKRRRSMKSPSRRPNTSAASHIVQSPLGDSVSAILPRHQSPLADSSAVASLREPQVGGLDLGKQSLARRDLSKVQPVRDWVKRSPVGGDPVPHLPRRDSTSESGGLGKSTLIDYRRNNSKNSTSDSIKNAVGSINSERATNKSEEKRKAKEVTLARFKKSKISIETPVKNEGEERPANSDDSDMDDGNNEVQEQANVDLDIEDDVKIWNLRPRKPIQKSMNGGSRKNNAPSMSEKSKAQSSSKNLPNKGKCKGGGEKEKSKLSISVSLSKAEIEEDFFPLTGSKPARRPRKRPKNVQKQLDSLFPGLWLVSISADSYKVSENSLKG